MNLFVSEIVTPPTHLPVTVEAAQEALAGAVVDELERSILWRAIVSQERRIFLDGPLPRALELEPVSSVVSLTRWTPTDAAEVVAAATYHVITRQSGTTIAPAPGSAWPAPFRLHGSFALTYMAGWAVTDTSNKVPASVRMMVEKAIDFRAGSGLGDIEIGSLKMDVDESYKTDRLPREPLPPLPAPTHGGRASSQQGLEHATGSRAHRSNLSNKGKTAGRWDASTRQVGSPWSERDIRGRRTFTYSNLDVLIEKRPGIDRNEARVTERQDDTVLSVFEPLAITDDHLFQFGDPPHTHQVKAVDGILKDEDSGIRYFSEVSVIR